MLNFDYITLDAFLKENSDFLIGARLQKIQQPTRQELIFTMRNHGENRKFYVNINPLFFHVCFMSKENEQKRFLKNPKSALMFCMLLRKYLNNSKIERVCQPEGERILEFYFNTYAKTGEKFSLCLAIELMGKHSNVVLYNFDTNMIIGCAHNVGSDKSRERELIGGLPYTYPQKRDNKITKGFSQILFQDEKHQSRLGLPTQQQKVPDETKSAIIDNYFAHLQSEEKIKSLKSKLLVPTNAKLKKVKTALGKIKNQSGDDEKAQNYRKYGDLIMARVNINNTYLSQIEVLDWETNLPLKIKLDETQTLKENASRFYKLYNKAKSADVKSQEIVDSMLMEQENLEQILYSIENAQSVEDLLEIEEEIGEEVKRQRGKEVKGYKNYASMRLCIYASENDYLKSFTIYVGRNNKQNDYIVSKLARPNDIWFHTHNCAGSHVLLRVEAGQTVTDEIIFECAKLAKEYSSAKLSKIGVIYTQAKNLKKPPAAALGYVTYKNEKEIIID